MITPEARKEKSIAYLKEKGIPYFRYLPTIESSNDVNLKSLDNVCKRAATCLFSTQIACDVRDDGDYEKSKLIFGGLVKLFGLEDELFPIEKRIFNNDFSRQDILDVVWTYECYWMLLWALGIIDTEEVITPDKICDSKKAIAIFQEFMMPIINHNFSKSKNFKLLSDTTFENFKKAAHFRDVEEILDMLDLYYRYHWACVQHRIDHGKTEFIIDEEIVLERRRALEWLISDEFDWNNIRLDT